MFRKIVILLGSLVVSLGLAAFSGSSRPAAQAPNTPAWIQVLLILAIVVIFVLLEVLLVWWLRRRSKAAPTPMPRPKVEAHAVPPRAEAPAVKSAPVVEPVPPVPAVKSVPLAPDDLKLIEGIGPKIASILAADGITTFAQLGATDVSRLKEIIAQAGLTALADPASWPEQAALAAAGKMAELEALQGQLKGGRRVDKNN
jgi:predicted flap endonuclease-1-like 5' DNA nuclease